MKRVNKFELLPREDQQFILKTCDDNSYDTALKILARPRSEGGLAFTTSRSALCRFYTHHHADHRAIAQLGQFAEAVRVNGQMHLSSAYEALVTLVQSRLLEGLKQGKAIADLDRDFRTLERLQRCFLQDENRRRQDGEKVRAAYWSHLEKIAMTPEADFIRNDVKNDPGAAECVADEFEEDTNVEMDLVVAQEKVDRHQLRHVSIPDLLNARRATASARILMGNFAASPSNSPDFPHFPPDSIPNFTGTPRGGKRGPGTPDA